MVLTYLERFFWSKSNRLCGNHTSPGGVWQCLRSYLCRNKGNSKWCNSREDGSMWPVCFILTCGRVFIQEHKCTGEHSASRWHLTRQKRGMWKPGNETSHFIRFSYHSQMWSVPSQSVLLSITNTLRVLASSHPSEILGCPQQINWVLRIHESKHLLIAHYLGQTYCSVCLLSPSVYFSYIHVAWLCDSPLERIP